MRLVQRELLDSLPHDDPAAQRSRRELLLINRIMGNHRWVCRTLSQREVREDRVLELGAGDGSLARHVWNDGIMQPSQWSALDLAPAPPDWPDAAAWHQRDLFDLMVLPDVKIIVANLFLHHLQNSQLALLGTRLPESCRTLLVCEPARRRVYSLMGRLLCAMIQLSSVTRHDMLASIRAGFLGDELAQALGLHGWQTTVKVTSLGAYRFTATR